MSVNTWRTADRLECDCRTGKTTVRWLGGWKDGGHGEQVLVEPLMGSLIVDLCAKQRKISHNNNQLE